MKRTLFTLLATASIPALLTLGAAPATAQTSGVINGCVDSGGVLRLVGATGRTCRSTETFISWNIQGPTGPAGATGPVGPRGPAGPQTVMSAVVLGNGTVQVANMPAGAALNVTRLGVGNYRVQITGLGTRCVLPSVNAIDSATAMYLQGGSCGAGTVTLPVRTLNGQDSAFVMTAIGLGPDVAAAATAGAQAALQQAAAIQFGER